MLALLTCPLIFANSTFADTSNAPASASCGCKKVTSHMAKELQLSDSQITQIEKIKAKSRVKMKSYKQQLEAIRIQLKNFITADNVDDALLDKLINQKTTLMTTMTKSKIMTKNQIYKILNPQQKMQFKEMIHSKCQCDSHSA